MLFKSKSLDRIIGNAATVTERVYGLPTVLVNMEQAIPANNPPSLRAVSFNLLYLLHGSWETLQDIWDSLHSGGKRARNRGPTDKPQAMLVLKKRARGHFFPALPPRRQCWDDWIGSTPAKEEESPWRKSVDHVVFQSVWSLCRPIPNSKSQHKAGASLDGVLPNQLLEANPGCNFLQISFNPLRGMCHVGSSACFFWISFVTVASSSSLIKCTSRFGKGIMMPASLVSHKNTMKLYFFGMLCNKITAWCLYRHNYG